MDLILNLLRILIAHEGSTERSFQKMISSNVSRHWDVYADGRTAV
jgi:hypothetical protein